MATRRGGNATVTMAAAGARALSLNLSVLSSRSLSSGPLPSAHGNLLCRSLSLSLFFVLFSLRSRSPLSHSLFSSLSLSSFVLSRTTESRRRWEGGGGAHHGKVYRRAREGERASERGRMEKRRILAMVLTLYLGRRLAATYTRIYTLVGR